MGSHGRRRDIPVYVSGNVGQVHRDAVLLAVRIWIAAQDWFSEIYMSGEGYPFFLYLSNKRVESAITVSFVAKHLFNGLFFNGIGKTPKE